MRTVTAWTWKTGYGKKVADSLENDGYQAKNAYGRPMND